MKKLYAIGDVHGCHEALRKMLLKIEEDRAGAEATVVFLGDYVDRGPDSAGVIRRLRLLKTEGVEYVFLRGNHEDMMLDNDQTMTWLYNGGRETIRSYDEFAATLGTSAPDLMKDDAKWMRENLKLYHAVDKFLFVHAGISPHSPIENQDSQIFIWARDFNKYDGDYVGGWNVVHGHTPIEKPLKLRHQLNIDTGCVFGKSYSEYGNLTCAVLHDGWDNVRYLQTRETDLGSSQPEQSPGT